VLKVFGGVVLGVFVGAVAFELLKKKSPDLLQNIERKAEEFVEAFKEGYHSRGKTELES